MCLERDIDELFKARKYLVRPGKDTKRLTAMYVLRHFPSPQPGEGLGKKEDSSGKTTPTAPLLTLFIIPKRSVRRSHERHRIQRWFREAVRLSPITKEIEGILQSTNTQVLFGLRAELPPSKELNWPVVASDIEVILSRLLKVLQQE